MRVAVCIGHNIEQKGAYSEEFDVSEWDYNIELAAEITNLSNANNEIDVYPFARYPHPKGFGAEIEALADRVNAYRPDLAFELHANSSGPDRPPSYDGSLLSYWNSINYRPAQGREVLYWHKTADENIDMARDFLAHIGIALANYNRGVKPRTIHQNGGKFLQLVRAPAFILEPFFITHYIDAGRGMRSRGNLAIELFKAIEIIKEKYFKCESI